LVSFVKSFFQVFQKLFQELSKRFFSCNRSPPGLTSRSSDSFSILAYRFQFVKNFFSSLFKFLFDSLICGSVLPNSLHMISHRFQFVKNFFRSFSNFFDLLSLHPLSRDSLHIIPPQSQFVNT
ncbi:MAG: hypothetical protein J6C98_08855, partial [Oscillospiraceae bacterium]|nr:hypothetical protein [Oscillospiraceae bacterium]